MGDFRSLSGADMIYLLPPLHPLQVEAQIQSNSENLQKTMEFAINRTLSISPATHGVWTRVEDYKVWRVHVITPGAYSVGLIFDSYQLGEGVKLMIYDPQKKHLKGAYTSLNNKHSGIFAVGHVPGEEVIIELQVPASLVDYGELSLGSLSHAFLPISLKGTRVSIFLSSSPRSTGTWNSMDA